MNKKLTILLVIIMIVILIISGILAFLLILNMNSGKTIYIPISSQESNEELSQLYTRNQLYTVKGCINKYYMYGSMLPNSSKIIYNMLDKEYIENRSITEENISSIISKTNESIIYINEMYLSEKNNNINVFFVYGTLRDKTTNNISNFKMIVKIDYSSGTFSIIPEDYINNKYSKIKIGDKIDIDTEKIEKNDNNEYIYVNISEQAYVNDLFSDFKDRYLYDIESLYERLDEEYKKAKFNSAREMKEYIDNKYKNISGVQVSSYNIEKFEEYDRYTVIDTNGNYIIFNEKDAIPFKYTLMLDTYTIDLPEFIESYNTNYQERVILNLNKIMQALNNQDYKFVYNKLANSFKTANFPTLDSFITYAKTNFYRNNSFEYLTFGSEGTAYFTYNLNIGDNTGKNTNIINKTFIMSLGEDTDFEFSFSI